MKNQKFQFILLTFLAFAAAGGREEAGATWAMEQRDMVSYLRGPNPRIVRKSGESSPMPAAAPAVNTTRRVN